MDLYERLGLDKKQADDNVVFYTLYNDDVGRDPEDLRHECMRLVLPYLAGYVWQKDPFRLTCSTAQPPPWHAAAKKRRGGMAAAASAAPAAAAADHPPPCLWGVLHFGDNIEDEWFVVSLLLHLTKQLPGVSAQVWDNDGEFLLIEAALDLPRWLKPETSAHRVWLRGGGVHIVPLPSAQHPSLQPFPTLSQALQVLRSGSVDTRAPKIEQHVVRRLRGYPAAGVKQMQRVRCVLPLRAAAVLRACPQLVAPAVEAFYLRDADDMRTAARMQTFPPQDMVTCLVTLNRAMYGQLRQQRFGAPKGWPDPAPGGPTTAEGRAADLGLKLTAGLEIAYARSSRHVAPRRPQGPWDPAAFDAAAAAGTAAAAPAAAAAAAAAAALSSNPAWRAYVDRLSRAGFFGSELQGSAKYKQLLEAAAKSFVASEEYERSVALLAAPAAAVDEALSRQPPLTAADFAVDAGAVDDGEEWMEEQAAALEAELKRREAEAEALERRRQQRRSQRRQNGPASAKRGNGDDAASSSSSGSDNEDDDDDDRGDEACSSSSGGDEALDAVAVAAQLRRFVDHVSSFEGAEVPPPGDEQEVVLNMQKLLKELEHAVGAGTNGGSGTNKGGGDSRAVAQVAQHHHREKEARSNFVADEDSDWDEDSSSEGSSFFSGEGSDEDGDDEDGEEEAKEESASAAAFRAWKQMRGVPAGVQSPHRTGDKVPGAAALERSEAASAGTRRTAGAARWEACTATDSDDDASGTGGADDDDDAFMEAYDAALRGELRGTKMAEDFRPAAGTAAAVKAQQARGAASAGGGEGRAPAAAAARSKEEDDEDEDEGGLQPVDVDMNLVASLLESVAGQQGLPGPASNLAGLLGLRLAAAGRN